MHFYQRVLILGRHTVTLLKFRLNPTHMAPFSVNNGIMVGLGLENLEKLVFSWAPSLTR